MRSLGLSGLLLSCLLALFAMAPGQAGAAAPKPAEMRVSLFGQPCVLQGPVDERTLKLVHSLSPEQLYPPSDAPLSSTPTRRALEKVRTITGAPTGLDRYRERITKRLEAQLAFLEALESSRKDHKSAPLLATAKTYLSGHRQKEFETAVKKAETAKSLANREAAEALFDTYNEGIEADPEEEFHRAIQRLNIQYVCSFEENGEAVGGANGSD